jgi:hypothetical protein
MKKLITTVFLAATAVAALSACEVEDTSGDGGNAADTGSSEAKSSYTVPQQNAIKSAQSYLQMSGMSRAGLIHQLTAQAGEGYKRKDAVFAVNHIKVDWKKEAVQSAKGYLDMGGMSRASLIQQLTSKAGEQFTRAQAEYAADKVGL